MLTDSQRALVLQVDALLNRLACDIVMGPSATTIDVVRAGFRHIAGMLRRFDAAELSDLAAFVDERAPGLDADVLEPFHQAVCESWADWYNTTRAAAPELPVARVEDAPEPVPAGDDFGFAEPGTVPGPAAIAPAPPEPRAVVRPATAPPPAAPSIAALVAAAADDEDLVVLGSDPEMTSMFVSEALDHLGTIEATVLELESSPEDRQLLDDVFRPFHTIKGNAGALGVVSVQEFAHKVENLLDLARAGQHHMGPDECEIVLRAVDVLTTMISELPARIAGARPADTTLVRTYLVAQIDQLTSHDAPLAPSAEALAPAVDPAGGEDAIPVEPAAGEVQPEFRQRRTDGHGQTSVKVDTGKLDSLIDMIGELVISQALIYEDPNVQRVAGERLQRNLAQVRRITTDLQRNAMAMRLVPIKPTFQKMARLVRDLSRKSGKPVDLVLAGEDTELDRKVIEEINDPLMHMIRNSVDHGIEPSAVRVKHGKRPEGRLSLSAAHQGGNIVIEIADDGGGLNTEKILRKAMERGIVPSGDGLSPSEIQQLIFRPGFSTADEITEISGRGVGMDVVRRNIEALRGRIEIHTTAGAGTTFQIKLPLTLAILDGLTLQVGGQRFVLPTFSIRESLRPLPQQVHHVQGRPRLIQVREQLMPLMWLSDVFAITGAREDATQATVVVIEDDGQLLGLVVDELVGKQEVVIKSLGETFAGVRGVAGGAILGDGRVGLILDAGSLIGMLSNPPARAA
jgi:two-component system chemotaxis sensor kinase CheA